jgi:hypothetical protein
VSIACAISRRLPSVSGSGSAANMPKRPGWSRAMPAPNSLHSRAHRRPCSLSFHHTPGLVIDTMAARTLALSICSIANLGDQLV